MTRLTPSLLPVLCTTADLDVAGATADVFAARPAPHPLTSNPLHIVEKIYLGAMELQSI
jgi:hypothetical protein